MQSCRLSDARYPSVRPTGRLFRTLAITFILLPFPLIRTVFPVIPAYCATRAAATYDTKSLAEWRQNLLLHEKSANFTGAGAACMNIGEIELGAGNTDAALHSFRKALSFYEKGKNAIGRGNALYRIGEISARKGNHAEALDAYGEALPFFKASPDSAFALNVTRNMANLYGVMADASFRNGDYRKALDLYRKGSTLLDGDKEPAARAVLRRSMGDSLARLENPAGASEAYGAAALDYEKAGNRTGAAAMHRKRGDLNLLSGNSRQAFLSYEAARVAYEKSSDLARVGMMYLLSGRALQVSKDAAKAKGYLEKAIPLLESRGAAADLLEATVSLGELYAEGGLVQQAFSTYSKGLALIGGNRSDPKIERRLYRDIAEIHATRGENQKALEYLEKTVQLAGVSGAQGEYAEALQRKGEIYLISGDNLKAAESFSASAEAFRRHGNDAGAGRALAGTGDALYFSGDAKRAGEKYSAALLLLRKSGNLKGLGGVNRRLGDLAMQEGSNRNALAYYEKAYALYSEAGDRKGMGSACSSMADLYTRMGEAAKAMEYQTKSRALLENSGDPLGEAHALRSKGDIYLRTGNNAGAVELYREALLLYRKAGDTAGEGNVIRAIGNVNFQSGKYDDALKSYSEALPLLLKGGDLPGQGNVRQNMGDIDYLKGDYQAALKNYSEALITFERCSDQLGIANSRKSQADVYVMMSDMKTARSLYQAALVFYARAGDTESQAHVSFGMAKAASAEGLHKKALEHYQEGLGLLEKVRKQSALAQMKKGFLEKVYDFYNEAIVFMLNNGFAEAALHTAESVKARLFLDQLAEAQVDLDQGIGEELREKKKGLESRIAGLRREIAEASHGTAGSKGGAGGLVKSLATAENELAALQIDIRLNNPMYAAVQYPEPVTTKQLRKVLDSGEVLLEYFISAERVYCFILSGGELGAFTLPLTRKQLENRADELLSTIRIGPGISSYKFESASMALYDALVRPIEKQLANRTVIIVPDGPLLKIPFEVLIRRERNRMSYFLENNPLKYSQSATLLALQRTTLRKDAYGGSFAGFGDPVYDYAAFIAGKEESDILSPSGQHRLPRLEASGREVAAIRGIFASRNMNTRTFLRAEARTESAKSDEMRRYGYIHFAAHGIMDNKIQAIALSRIPGSSGDGFLTIGDIMKSRYTASRLVVLSACGSGLGEFNRGEGVTGLTRAVMYSGAPAAVVSLWNVSDMATKTLMEKFYDNIITRGMPLEKGLRAAKLEMTEQGNLRHPLFWGGFIMYGE